VAIAGPVVIVQVRVEQPVIHPAHPFAYIHLRKYVLVPHIQA
jgi:hypothetical protein